MRQLIANIMDSVSSDLGDREIAHDNFRYLLNELFGMLRISSKQLEQAATKLSYAEPLSVLEQGEEGKSFVSCDKHMLRFALHMLHNVWRNFGENIEYFKFAVE